MDESKGLYCSEGSDSESFALLSERLCKIRENIESACLRCGRSSKDITLVGVSKFKPFSCIKDAWKLGLSDFGENYVQEAREKAAQLPEAKWHIIGNLQKNKINAALEFADVIHSLDSESLISNIDKKCLSLGRFAEGLIQVRLGGEESKSGVDPDKIFEMLDRISENPPSRLRLVGLMTIPPPSVYADGNRRHFETLRKILEKILDKKYTFWHGCELSMGMSSDYEAAIEEGATYIRVGRALFGERSYKNC